VRAFLDTHVYAEPRRQRLLEPDADAQADDGRERAVGDGRCDFNEHGADWGAWGGGVCDEDVREVYDGEGAEGEGVLGV